MIIGVGIDLADSRRIEKIYKRFGIKFAAKILSPTELEKLPDDPIPYLAGRFAAREAFVKALGTGFSKGVDWLDTRVENDRAGRPVVFLKGRAEVIARDLGVKQIHLSISHERHYAVAMVILEG
ncbi:MAG: holo-ACP synthase [Desulfovibrio sp.]|nr:holo-ACP synthase [Desulfovibrio sp.]